MSTPHTAFVLSGVGMSMFFVPVGTVVLGSVRPQEQGLASGANNAIRELGGGFGVAVLSSFCAASGSYLNPQSFVDGLKPAVAVGAAIVAIGAVAALGIRRFRPDTSAQSQSEIAPSAQWSRQTAMGRARSSPLHSPRTSVERDAQESQRFTGRAACSHRRAPLRRWAFGLHVVGAVKGGSTGGGLARAGWR